MKTPPPPVEQLKPCPFCDGPVEDFKGTFADMRLVRHEGQPHCLLPGYAITVEQWNFRRFDTERTAELERENAALREAGKELADLMDDVVEGNYTPDSFTTQPMRNALGGRPT